MAAIHQFLAGYSKGDAISNEARVLRALFRKWGATSTIFCEASCIHPELRRDVMDVHTCVVNPEDIVLLHLSIGSIVNEVFARLSCQKAILYHNITPHEFFVTFKPQAAEKLRLGRDQMEGLAGAAQVNMADSEYNSRELKSAGYLDVRVLPIVLDFKYLAEKPDAKVLCDYQDEKKNILFVGRCAPNKCIDDLVRTFAYYQRHVEPHSRLIHVGSFTGMEAYYSLCRIQAKNLGLRDVHFMGSVTQSQLSAFYHVADVFLSVSEHEGFCIPLLESMYFDVPILAYAAGAVAETLAESGILFRKKEKAQIAEMIGRLTRNTSLRNAVIHDQRQRLQQYQSLDLEVVLRKTFTPLLENDPSSDSNAV